MFHIKTGFRFLSWWNVLLCHSFNLRCSQISGNNIWFRANKRRTPLITLCCWGLEEPSPTWTETWKSAVYYFLFTWTDLVSESVSPGSVWSSQQTHVTVDSTKREQIETFWRRMNLHLVPQCRSEWEDEDDDDDWHTRRVVYLSDAQSVGQDPVHGVGLHLRPLQVEAVDARPVLPQSAVSVVVELWSVGLPWADTQGSEVTYDYVFKLFTFVGCLILGQVCEEFSCHVHLCHVSMFVCSNEGEEEELMKEEEER